MGNDAIAHRVATGLFNLNGKLTFQPKNKFSALFLAFLNLCLLSKCLLDVVFNSCCLIVTLFITHFYKHATLIKLCLLSVNRSSPVNFVTSLKLVLFFTLVYYFLILLADLTKIFKNVFHPKFITNLLLIILLSSLHISDLSLTIQIDYNHRWALWLHIDGDIQENPGPKTENFRFFHWNANSLPAHNFSRISLIEAYNALHDFHIIAISESALKPSTPDSQIEIPGFTPIRSDLTGTDTHGGALIYHKHNLSVKPRPDLATPSYTLVLELSINRKKVFFIHSYRKSGQTSQEAKTFSNLYDEMIEKIDHLNPYMTLVVGDFNAHHKNWFPEGKTDSNGVAFKQIFDNYGLTQLVKEPTFLNPSNPNSRTCVDLFATNQPNLVIANEIHPSLHNTCHHQINFVKLNLNSPVPDPSKRFIWHYSRGDEQAIRRSCLQFNWRETLGPLHACDAIELFDKTILNISKNFIPNELKTFNPKDPPWITKACKNAYTNYRRKFKRFVNRKCPQADKPYIDGLKCEYSDLVLKEKDRYLKRLGSEVSNPMTGQKKYWSALKKLLNKKAFSVIPPILHDGSFITDFKEKCQLFNEYFRKQCTLNETSSILPNLNLSTDLLLNDVNFSPVDITNHINKLNINKAHGHDGIPARIIKICGDSIADPLSIIFKKCLSEGCFPLKWKKANVIPIHKKNEKNLFQNYRPVSLLPICAKLFEKIIFDNLYTYIFGNNFISNKQSGYRRGDSTVKQLVSITHEIYKAFDDGKELRAVFLDISKAFDKVWAEGLIFKLKKLGIGGQMIAILSSFLKDRKQRVTMDGVCSDWADIESGVPQGSILGPILFLVYIDDLINEVSSDIRIFADDTFIFRVVDSDSSKVLNQDLQKITVWAYQWKMIFNPDLNKQAVEVVFSNKRVKTADLPLTFNGIPVKKQDNTTHLGLLLDSNLNFESHLEGKLAKARSGLGLMKQLKQWVSYQVLDNIYKLYVRPHLDYCDIIYHQATIDFPIFNHVSSNPLMKNVETIQYEAARVVSGAWKGTNRAKLYENLGWESTNDRRVLRKLCNFYETIDTKFPSYLYNTIKSREYPSDSRSYNMKLLKPIHCSNPYKNSFFPSTIRDWNALEKDIKEAKSLQIFKKRLLNKIRPKKASYFGIRDNDKIKYLTMLRLGLSPLREHKYRHGFLDTSDPLCLICKKKEDTEHFLLLCKSFTLSRTTLMHQISEVVGENISALPKRTMVSILLFGRKDLDNNKRFSILNHVLEYIVKSKRLDTI